MLAKPEITVSSSDYDQLSDLLEGMRDSPSAKLLMEEIERATVVEDPQVPVDVVTMYSTVTFTLLSTGKVCTYTLVYPSDADAAMKKLSVLSPVGSALLGLSVGQEIEWPLSDNKRTHLRIDEVVR